MTVGDCRAQACLGLLLSVAGLVACTSSDGPNLQVPPSRSPGTAVSAATTSSSVSVTPTSDAQVALAVSAFNEYFGAARNAERNPPQLGKPYPADADFTKTSFDPLRAEYRAYILGLAQQGTAYRGTTPDARIKVESVNLAAQPYPTVTLSNCPLLPPTWAPYTVKTGKDVAMVTPSPPLPYRSTINMIFYQGHWGAQKLVVDRSQTCTP
jgi:hypothetical protein